MTTGHSTARVPCASCGRYVNVLVIIAGPRGGCGICVGCWAPTQPIRPASPIKPERR